MTREQILQNIRQSKPEERALPKIDNAQFRNAGDLKTEFSQNLEAIAGKVIKVKSHKEIGQQFGKLYPEVRTIISCIRDLELSTFKVTDKTPAQDLEQLDVALVEARFGVAENGAVWISDKDMPHRIIPFIASHLAVLLPTENIVETMHDAYTLLSDFDEGFGVFIAGPSKTADIEQSLVIGAQGALSLTAFLVG